MRARPHTACEAVGSSPYETRYLITARGLHDVVVGRELEFPKYVTHLTRARHPTLPRLVPRPPVRSLVDLTLNSPLPTVRHRSALRAPRLTLEAKYTSRPVLARRTCSIASSAPALISIWTLIPAPFVNKSTFRRTANCHRASFVSTGLPPVSPSPSFPATEAVDRRACSSVGIASDSPASNDLVTRAGQVPTYSQRTCAKHSLELLQRELVDSTRSVSRLRHVLLVRDYYNLVSWQTMGPRWTELCGER
jgi:hypothetical protein